MLRWSNIATLRPLHSRLVGVGVFLLSASAFALLIWNQDLRREQFLRTYAQSLVTARASAIESTVARAVAGTYTLGALVQQAHGVFADFDKVAAQLQQQFPAIAALSLSPGGVVQRVAPLPVNRGALGLDQLHDPAHSELAHQAMRTGKPVLAGPLKLMQGDVGVVVRLPVYLPRAGAPMRGAAPPEFWGFASAALRLQPMLATSGIDQLIEEHMAYALVRENPRTHLSETIAASSEAPLGDPVERRISVPQGSWTLRLAPVNGWSDPIGVAWKAVFAAGFSALLAWACSMLLRLKRHELGLEVQVLERTREIQAAQDRLAATLDAIPDLLLELDSDGTVRSCRQPPHRKSSQRLDLLAGQRLSSLLSSACAQTLAEALALAASLGHVEGLRIKMELEGGLQWFELSVSRTLVADGPALRYTVLARDITQRVQADQDLAIAATAFNAHDAMAITDKHGRILRCNPAFSRMTGYDEAEVVGQGLLILRSGRHPHSFYEEMWQALCTRNHWQGEVWNRRKNGEVFPTSRSATAVRDASGDITHIVNTFSDITQRKAAEDEINQLAYYDPLTQLPNRRLLLDRLGQTLALNSRTRQYGALQFIDLDNFKTLNDTQGHDMGDLLLQQVAARLSDCVRAVDTVARIGGDEFVVLLTQLGEQHDQAAAHAESIGEKVRTAICRTYHLGNTEFELSASIGITLYHINHNSVEDLLKQADLAMYQAKAAGRNTLRFYDPQMQVAINRRAALEADIRRALLQGQFALHYQLQVDRQGRALGAEALLRWTHPVHGMVQPSEFIALAEDTGLIVPLGQWVLQAACEQLQRWRNHPHTRDLALALNVSARQFRQADFVEQVLQVFRDTGAPTRQLKLELTESLLVNDMQDTIAKMQALKSHGIGFALDDFGTGYSSLSYLKRMPLDQLKIDRSFVDDVLTDPNDSAIARTVIALGHSLGLAVIAEGVETTAQRDFLATAGCDAYQGFLFGRPLPVEAFQDALAAL